MTRTVGDLALALGGGGARSAYQAGFLLGVAKNFPELSIPILTGVSAGAINTTFLANHMGGIVQATERLVDLWTDLHTEQVFDARALSLLAKTMRWGARLMSGGHMFAPQVHGMVDTRPLARFLAANLPAASGGELPGIQANIDRGMLKAVAITTTHYATGQSITWVQGRRLEMWQRPQRRSVEAALGVSHVMASCSLPLFFPAIKIGEEWHGDGGIRLTAPLSPALHLGAQRILAISTRYQRTQVEADRASTQGYPPPAQVLGVLMNAIFLDMFDYDAMSLDRLNKLIAEVPDDKRGGLREVELLILRPSRDLGRIAGEYEMKLPRSFRYLMRGLGTRDTKTPDSLSMVLFEPDYVQLLLKLGEEDAHARRDDLAAFLVGERLPAINRTGFWRI
jgi:NTE family protein